MTAQTEVLYQLDAYRYTPKTAMQAFARDYWAEARKAWKLKTDGTFHIMGGTKTYRVVLVSATRTAPACYQITVQEA